MGQPPGTLRAYPVLLGIVSDLLLLLLLLLLLTTLHPVMSQTPLMLSVIQRTYPSGRYVKVTNSVRKDV